jgi:hypothetical protein
MYRVFPFNKGSLVQGSLPEQLKEIKNLLRSGQQR